MSIWWKDFVAPEPVTRHRLVNPHGGGKMPDEQLTDTGGWRRVWHRWNRGPRDSYGEEGLSLYAALARHQDGQWWGCLVRWRWNLFVGHDHHFWDHDEPLLLGDWHDTPDEVNVEATVRAADPLSLAVPAQCPAWRWSAADVAEYRGLAHEMSGRRWLAEQNIAAQTSGTSGRLYDGQAVVRAAAAMTGRGHGGGRPATIVTDTNRPRWWIPTYTALQKRTDRQLINAVVRLARAVRDGETGVAVDDLAIYTNVLSHRYTYRPLPTAPPLRADNPRVPGEHRPTPLGELTRSRMAFVADIVRDDHPEQTHTSPSVFRSVTAAQIRAVFGSSPKPIDEELHTHRLATLPRQLPVDDTARVLVYDTGSGISRLISGIAASDASATVKAITHIADRLGHGHSIRP